jgi:hypothetical protein
MDKQSQQYYIAKPREAHYSLRNYLLTNPLSYQNSLFFLSVMNITYRICAFLSQQIHSQTNNNKNTSSRCPNPNISIRSRNTRVSRNTRASRSTRASRRSTFILNDDNQEMKTRVWLVHGQLRVFFDLDRFLLILWMQSCSLLLGDVLLAMLMLPLIQVIIPNSISPCFSFNAALGFLHLANIYLSKPLAVQSCLLSSLRYLYTYPNETLHFF